MFEKTEHNFVANLVSEGFLRMYGRSFSVNSALEAFRVLESRCERIFLSNSLGGHFSELQ